MISCEKKQALPPTIKKTTPTDTNSGKIFTIAGNGYASPGGYTGDGGQATTAELHYPEGVALDGSGNIYISDVENSVVRKVNTNGVISTIAGLSFGYSGDGGPATAAEFEFPTGVAADGSGNVYITDNYNNRVRKVNASGIISTLAGNGVQGETGDGGPATAAEISSPYGVTFDGAGNIYIAEGIKIRKVNTSGIITTFAGGGSSGLGDGGPATACELFSPEGVAVDGFGNVYIADYQTNRIRMVNTSGIISTIAGNGYTGGSGGAFYGDGGPATAAELFNPTALTVDGSGNVYIFDASNYRIRVVNSSGIISTVVGNGSPGFSGDGGAASSAEIGYGQGVAVDGLNNLYFSNMYFNRIRIIYK